MIKLILTVNDRDFEITFTYRFEGIDNILIWNIDDINPPVTDEATRKHINDACDAIADTITKECEIDHKENLSCVQDFKRGIV